MIATSEPAAPRPAATSDASPDRAASALRKAAPVPYGEERTRAGTLEQAVRHRIAQRTWGRLRQLQVEADAQHVLVRGSSPTYYLKQLALTAVQEALPGTRVELDIRVVKGAPGLIPAGTRRANLLAERPRPIPGGASRRFC